MEKFQPHSGEPSSISGGGKTLVAIIASGILGACSSVPERAPTIRYIDERPLIASTPVYLEPTPYLLSKTHTHNGPLGDKMCTYVYNTSRRVLELCEYKPAKDIRRYSKVIPGKYITIPPSQQYIPGSTELAGPKWEYGYNPSTRKYEYHLSPGGLKQVPGKVITIPEKTEYKIGKTEICTVRKPYSQINGTELPHTEHCL